MRVTDSVLKTNYMGNAYKDGEASLLNLTVGSQNGLHIQLGKLDGGVVYDQFCNAQPYTTRNIIPFLMQAPRAMKFYPEDGKQLIASLKELVEAKPSKISGINLKISVDSTSITFGSFLEFEEPTKVSYEKSSVTMEYYEIKNKSIQRYWEFYIRNFIGDPFSQLALAGNVMGSTGQAETEGIYTYDFRSFTTCFVEPDDFGMNVVDACMVFNMWPKDAGDNELSMDRAGERETRNYSIPFAGTPVKTNLVLKYAYQLLSTVSLTNYIPDDVIIPTANQIDAEVKSAGGGFVPSSTSKGQAATELNKKS